MSPDIDASWRKLPACHRIALDSTSATRGPSGDLAVEHAAQAAVTATSSERLRLRLREYMLMFRSPSLQAKFGGEPTARFPRAL
jgi:hypothetical protein